MSEQPRVDNLQLRILVHSNPSWAAGEIQDLRAQNAALLAENERLQREASKVSKIIYTGGDDALAERCRRLSEQNAALREALTLTPEKVEAAHQWSGGWPHADIRAALLAAGMREEEQ